jgi:DNA-directed RNA polymerase subunit RPC12/RpoP
MGSFDFEHASVMQHYACFTCRKAFKVRGTYPHTTAAAQCPECKGPMAPMGVLFRAPRQRAVKAWAKLEELARTSTAPRFQYPEQRQPEGACPGCGCLAGLVGGRCPYCGYTRRAASGGRPSPGAYQPGSEPGE